MLVADVVPHGTERDVWAGFVASHVPVPHDAAEIRYSRTNSACSATSAVHMALAQFGGGSEPLGEQPASNVADVAHRGVRFEQSGQKPADIRYRERDPRQVALYGHSHDRPRVA